MPESSSIVTEAPQPDLNLRSEGGYEIAFPPVFSERYKIITPIFMVATMTPNNVNATINLGTKVTTGWSSINFERSVEGSMSWAQYFMLTARRRDDAVAGVLLNRVIVSVNLVEVARLYIDDDSGNCGWTAFAVPGMNGGDNRFILTSASPAGDLKFTFQNVIVDPSLELQLILAGGD